MWLPPKKQKPAKALLAGSTSKPPRTRSMFLPERRSRPAAPTLSKPWLTTLVAEAMSAGFSSEPPKKNGLAPPNENVWEPAPPRTDAPGRFIKLMARSRIPLSAT